MASRLPLFRLNRLVAGAGLDGADADAIPAAVARFRDAGQQKLFVQIPPSPNAAARLWKRRRTPLGSLRVGCAWTKNSNARRWGRRASALGADDP